MKRIVLIFSILVLILATTVTKHSTKKIDKEIFNLKEDIRFLTDQYELVLLDYNYLSSPQKLLEYQQKFFENELVPVDIQNLNQIKFINKIAILLTIMILINAIIFFDIKKYIKNLKMLFLTLITINLANLSFALGGILTFLGLKKIIVNKTYLVSRRRKN